MQVPGIMSGGQREWSAASSGMRACSGETLLDCRVITPSDIKCVVKRAKLLRWKEKQLDEMENGVWFEPSSDGENAMKSGLKKKQKPCDAWGD